MIETKTDGFGLAAIRNWPEVANDLEQPEDALGAALHREKHPSRRLDGVSCDCWKRAQLLLEWLEPTGWRLAK